MKNRKSGSSSSTLVFSEPDEVGLVRAVEDKFLTVCETSLQRTGNKLDPPRDLMPALFLWRQARIRHKQSDFRHSEDEMKATREVAEWTLEMNAKLRGQAEVPKVEWR